MATIGYARVSTEDQNLDLQIDALKIEGCDQIYEDHGISAIAKHRPGFEDAIDALQDGDTFIIWKMDRAFRSLLHALDMLEIFQNRNIEFRSLTDQIDTTTPMGKCMYQVRFAFAELERNLISERTKAGMAAARMRGKQIGRPYALSHVQVIAARTQLNKNPKTTLASIAREYGVNARTVARALQR